MPRFAKMPKGEGPVPTFLCRNRAEVTAALARIRTHLGISQNELDDIAGFNQGYTGKLEKPYTPGFPEQRASGRSAIHPMFDLWIGALKIGVLLVPLGTEPDVSRAVPAQVLASPMNTKRAEKIRARHRAGISPTRLAKEFGIRRSMVVDIIENRAFVPARKAA
jgi:hypothetical protein